MESKKKVIFYCIRIIEGKKELLVFDHQNMPEAGVQVVGGTVEPNEDLQHALVREVYEESGLTIFADDLTYLTETKYLRKDRPEINHRTYFYMINNQFPHRWEHQVKSEGEDNGMVFEFYWVHFERAMKILTGNFQEGLDLIK